MDKIRILETMSLFTFIKKLNKIGITNKDLVDTMERERGIPNEVILHKNR